MRRWVWRSAKVLGAIAALGLVAHLAHERVDRAALARLAVASTAPDPVVTGSIKPRRPVRARDEAGVSSSRR